MSKAKTIRANKRNKVVLSYNSKYNTNIHVYNNINDEKYIRRDEFYTYSAWSEINIATTVSFLLVIVLYALSVSCGFN